MANSRDVAERATPADSFRGRRATTRGLRDTSLLLVLFAASCTNSRDMVRNDVDARVVLGSESSIFGGATDDDRESAGSVVALKIASSGKFELCSATLIARNVVLTARHCVAKSISSTVACDENGRSTNGPHIAGDRDPASVEVYVGASPNLDNRANAVGRAIVAPESKHLCDSDIAIVVLDRALDDVEPARVRLRLDKGVTARDMIRSVGYGQNDKRIPIGTRLRRAGVPVLATGKGISKSKTALGVHEFEVGLSICQGDSGGPALSEDTGAVVGVVSRGGGCDDDYGHVYTTTSGWPDLFERAFAIAGGAPILESGESISPDPLSRAAFVTSPLGDRTDGHGCAASPNAALGPHGPLAVALALTLVSHLRRRRA